MIHFVSWRLGPPIAQVKEIIADCAVTNLGNRRQDALEMVSPHPRDNRPHKIDELYDALARMLDAGLPPDAPMSEEVGSKRLSNARLRASGFEPAWPDAIEGYRALISRRAPM